MARWGSHRKLESQLEKVNDQMINADLIISCSGQCISFKMCTSVYRGPVWGRESIKVEPTTSGQMWHSLGIGITIPQVLEGQPAGYRHQIQSIKE